MSHAPLIDALEDWLIAAALQDVDAVRLFETICDRLHALGIPLGRAVLSWPTLHPLFHAEQVFWRLGEGARLEQYYHSSAGSEAYLRSPFHFVHRRGLAQLRRRLAGEGAMADFDVLQDFQAQGFTDYLLTSTGFQIAEVASMEYGPPGIMASWATKREEGFTDDDLAALGHIQQLMAVACRASIQKRVMANLAEAYLGPTAARRVLSGEVKRGDGERIEAVVWFSDLRESTRLSASMNPDSYLGLLNRYFESTAQPVIDHGGEVLNFIGDGVLAIFPVDGSPRDAAARAEAAALASLDVAADLLSGGAEGAPPFRYGIGLAIGQVMFGNIGVQSRLAFSAIGRVVNEVQRVETSTRRFGHPLLATAELAALAPGRWTPAGRLEGREFARGLDVFALEEAAALAAQ